VSEFIIEDGIPLAKVRGRGRNPSQFRATVVKMKTGQSALLPEPAKQYQGSASFLRRQGFELAFRNVGTGCRVWVLKNPLLGSRP